MIIWQKACLLSGLCLPLAWRQELKPTSYIHSAEPIGVWWPSSPRKFPFLWAAGAFPSAPVSAAPSSRAAVGQALGWRGNRGAVMAIQPGVAGGQAARVGWELIWVLAKQKLVHWGWEGSNSRGAGRRATGNKTFLSSSLISIHMKGTHLSLL